MLIPAFSMLIKQGVACAVEGDIKVSIDVSSGIITNVTKSETYQAQPFPDFIKDMIAGGGLMASIKAKT